MRYVSHRAPGPQPWYWRRVYVDMDCDEHYALIGYHLWVLFQRRRAAWWHRTKRDLRQWWLCRGLHTPERITVDPFRQPYDQKIKLAFVSARCAKCRATYSVPVTLSLNEERHITSAGQLKEISVFKLSIAYQQLVRAMGGDITGGDARAAMSEFLRNVS
jgi:hypothetical protein